MKCAGYGNQLCNYRRLCKINILPLIDTILCFTTVQTCCKKAYYSAQKKSGPIEKTTPGVL